MTSSTATGYIPPVERLSFRSDTILRLKRPGIDALWPCKIPVVGKVMTREALEFRPNVIAYDYMEHDGMDYEDPSRVWASMLSIKPNLRPFCFRFQRGTGKHPKVVDCFAIGPSIYRRSIGERLLDLAEGKHPTLKPHYFNGAVRGRNPREDILGWLDMRNLFCWFTDITMWRDVGILLGINTDYPFLFIAPRWDSTFIISSGKPALVVPVELPEPVVVN